MAKLIFVKTRETPSDRIVNTFFNDLGTLMKIRGFQLIKHFTPQGEIAKLDWYSFAQKAVLCSLNPLTTQPPISQQVKTQWDKISDELSIFQLVDVFLFDELGLIEESITPLKQQLITIFSSRISAIAIVHRDRVRNISYLTNRFDLKFIEANENNVENMYSRLIRELYDR